MIAEAEREVESRVLSALFALPFIPGCSGARAARRPGDDPVPFRRDPDVQLLDLTDCPQNPEGVVR